MYVCICNAIRETELRRAALTTNGDAEATYAALGKRPNCGQCLEEAEAILFEERELSCETVAA
jgi:bacterioferritin-associated ferredoxin